MWDTADTNKDGVLDKHEWVAFSNPSEDPNMLPIILEQTLKEKDKDEDGEIDFQEYLADRGSEMNKEALLAEKVKFDEVLDRNHNGKLDGDEIFSWIIPSNE